MNFITSILGASKADDTNQPSERQEEILDPAEVDCISHIPPAHLLFLIDSCVLFEILGTHL